LGVLGDGSNASGNKKRNSHAASGAYKPDWGLQQNGRPWDRNGHGLMNLQETAIDMGWLPRAGWGWPPVVVGGKDTRDVLDKLPW
jgi:hypothetical protein